MSSCRATNAKPEDAPDPELRPLTREVWARAMTCHDGPSVLGYHACPICGRDACECGCSMEAMGRQMGWADPRRGR